MSRTDRSAAIDRALGRIEAHSPFLRNLVARRPEIVEGLRVGDLAIVLAAAREETADPARLARALRRERQAIALGLGLMDLAGLAPLEEVVTTLSDFADRALDRAIAAAIEERTPGAPVRGFAALGLGKHGSRELNYSSDIDPILLFDPERLPRREREEPVDAAVRIARRVVELLQTRDGDGYVFRVDLRLRPSPEATPLALPIEAAISYYESSALPWERAAFIRARAVAGDIALGQDFLAHIRPFVWRRGLDYGAIREIREMSRRIRDHHAQGQRLGPGYDVKRGWGGIREIEFFAQIHQLILGGRDPALRAPATLDALAALAGAGRIARHEADALGMAYRLLRTIEHRLQMVDDQQTHRLPPRAEALDNVARLHGLADGAALVALLAPHVEATGRIYDGLDPAGEAGLSRDPQLLENSLDEAGFADPAMARARIEGWREGRLRTLRNPAARAALEAVLPSLVAALGRAPDGNGALNRFDGLVSRLPSAINLFRLLEARPALVHMLANILSHAPTLADALGRRAELLDGLIDASALDPPPPTEALAAEFAAIEKGDDYQTLLDRVRQRVGERRFALGVQLIEGVSDPIEVASGYARVAEAAIEALAAATVAEFEAAHGRVLGGELVVLALGRLGGGALTHASDLDLIYLFTGDYMAESDGRRPLGATHYFNRLAQRVSAALSVPTPSGPLYEVDTRLRPSGAQGLLASSVESFARYERESAWTWEHMALTRARPIFGSAAARAAVEAIIAETLMRERDPAQLTEDVVHMRGEIAKHKPPAGPFDVKLIEGGLIDAEFAVHLLQLRHRIGFDPRLRRAAGALAEAGLLSPDFVPAHEFLTRLLVTLRLVSPQSGEPPEPSRPIVARACGQADWQALLAAYDEARALVCGEWRRVAGLG
ncbi:bifunctional [glutamate--ammonia ligase]-adenylyl-L-tyrosine phosphorylase/[glutamate--ammonia-ligase] adenylyltransferase [Sphingomonas oleivorans]|uniref:Bifunctional [glutamate--ammonia ligase]-adenylyl-L-tyrosine phosphorylase/[glutamate--ammonia-ligase] adenylyltransferase n=1 Tax=Sphingomonas oleivorans TaxID=1735121 RepID=A0A2T5FYR9_9SPHN|nr:bifunctional [glutamine synthetase] adenylyltransferase/[glutamine synthetase]-adenylyl-L-tyrosine phosphorylase [Sphingomonas oleivorans]PTQ11678.1 bifunctional [glutamate--ammonia ligase]-adenylyl-L-tyrosine phosphorylase/[glutamate--ammonia-ligase] adenylyltransferase [Sphingomonas oleivorans]